MMIYQNTYLCLFFELIVGTFTNNCIWRYASIKGSDEVGLQVGHLYLRGVPFYGDYVDDCVYNHVQKLDIVWSQG